MKKNGFAISSIVYSLLVVFIIIVFGILSILGSRKLVLDKLKNQVTNDLEGSTENYGEGSIELEANYRDHSGANAPDLFNGLVAVKYENNNWVVADLTQKWYDYDAKEWANAVVLKSGVTKSSGDILDLSNDVSQMYVWIPRYKYTIFNSPTTNSGVSQQQIEIRFEVGTGKTDTVNCNDDASTYNATTHPYSEICTDTTNSGISNGVSTYTHPAFCLGTRNNGVCNGRELEGIWFSKFEVSNVNSCTPGETAGAGCDVTNLGVQVRPNVTAWGAARVSTYYTVIKDVSTNYGINADSHMMKNMEWGAAAYLTNSKYGRCTDGTCTEVSKNDSSTFLTGKSQGTLPPTTNSVADGSYTYNDLTNGVKASTTGNVYGIYDMSGGAWEFTMANTMTSSGPLTGNTATVNSGFTGNNFDNSLYTGIPYPDYKYIDFYSQDGASYLTHSRGKLGDATKEITTVYGDYTKGWYDDWVIVACAGGTWFFRGGGATSGTGSGIFDSYYADGSFMNGSSTRIILSKSF